MSKNGFGQTVFTTGQIARMCKVAPRTCAKWCNSGKLRCYRLPMCQDRRVTREDLIAFLKEYHFPLGDLESDGWHKLLLIGAEPALVDRLRELLTEADDYRLKVARTGFEAGVLLGDFHAGSIVIDLAMGRSEGLQIAGNLRRDERYTEALIVALAGEDEASPESLMEATGVSDWLKKPFDPALLAERIRQQRFPAASNGADGVYKGGKGRKAR